MHCQVITLQTRISPITIVQTSLGVRHVDFDDGLKQFLRESCGELTRVPGIPPAAEEFRAYFRGELHAFSSPVDLVGTPFQVACWQAMRAIPYGQTFTYAQQAHLVPTRGYRAVGQANRINPVPILIPCHRVVAANGPGGYFGDRIWMKRALLEFEGFAWPEEWGYPLPEFFTVPPASIDEPRSLMLN